jgi:hypothetical protein
MCELTVRPVDAMTDAASGYGQRLADRGDRERVNLVDALGPGGRLVDGGGGPGQQFRLVETAGVGRDDVGHRDLAGVPVGATDPARSSPGLIPGDGTQTTLGAWDLAALMDQLDAIYPGTGEDG